MFDPCRSSFSFPKLQFGGYTVYTHFIPFSDTPKLAIKSQGIGATPLHSKLNISVLKENMFPADVPNPIHPFSDKKGANPAHPHVTRPRWCLWSRFWHRLLNGSLLQRWSERTANQQAMDVGREALRDTMGCGNGYPLMIPNLNGKFDPL